MSYFCALAYSIRHLLLATLTCASSGFGAAPDAAGALQTCHNLPPPCPPPSQAQHQLLAKHGCLACILDDNRICATVYG